MPVSFLLKGKTASASRTQRTSHASPTDKQTKVVSKNDERGTMVIIGAKNVLYCLLVPACLAGIEKELQGAGGKGRVGRSNGMENIRVEPMLLCLANASATEYPRREAEVKLLLAVVV
jgi:hypothetical protein